MVLDVSIDDAPISFAHLGSASFAGTTLLQEPPYRVRRDFLEGHIPWQMVLDAPIGDAPFQTSAGHGTNARIPRICVDNRTGAAADEPSRVS